MQESVFISIVIALFSFIDPHAAIGAAIGSLFHLSMPSRNGKGRILLPILSLGMGYSFGIMTGGSGTMLVSILVSALGSSIIIDFHSIIERKEDAPLWIKFIIDSIIRIRSGR